MADSKPAENFIGRARELYRFLVDGDSEGPSPLSNAPPPLPSREDSADERSADDGDDDDDDEGRQAPPLETQTQILRAASLPHSAAAAASSYTVAEPDHLLCPISFVLFHEPVMLVSGHTYEKQSVLRFWATRPLANPIGSGNAPPLRSAQMIINFGIRQQVAEWLERQPEGFVPSGWEELDRSARRATQEELDALADGVEERAKAQAAEAEQERRELEAQEEADAAALLPFGAARLLLAGELPETCACVAPYLGAYEIVPGRLVNGRHVYAQARPRGDEKAPPPAAEAQALPQLQQAEPHQASVTRDRMQCRKRPTVPPNTTNEIFYDIRIRLTVHSTWGFM